MAAAVAVAITFLPPSPDGAAVVRAASECTNGWTRLPVAGTLAAIEPQGVASLGGQPAWMVGINGPMASGARPPLIARWTGTEWARVASPLRGYGSLNAVQALSGNAAWTVGASGSYSRLPIAARWNGTSWSAVTVPKPPGQLATLADLAMTSPTRLWAAGARLDAGLSKPYVLLRANGRWRGRSPAIPAADQAGMTDVTRAPDGRIWIAGWRAPALAQGRAWIAFRTSAGWRNSTLASHPSGRSAVADLSFRSGTDGWAAGFVEQEGASYEPLLQRWNGTTWSNVPVPWASGRSVVLNAVEVDGSGRLTVAGTDLDELRSAVVATLVDGSWHVAEFAPGTPVRAAATDLASLTNGAVAVGFADVDRFVMVPCAGASAARVVGTPSRADSVSDGHRTDNRDPISNVAPAASVISSESVPGTVALDMTAAAGLNLSAPMWGGLVTDFNADDRPDFLVGRHFQAPWALFLNSADGVYSQHDGPALGDRHNCDAADVDQDSSMDVFCTIGVNKGTSIVPNELRLDVLDDGGVWATNSHGLLDGFGRGRATTFLNLNRDAYPDLFVANEPSRNDAMSSSNRLYRNVEGDHFAGAPEWGVDLSLGGICATAADLDTDGDDDLLVCAAEPHGALVAGTRAYVNNGSQLIDQTAALGVHLPFATAIEVGDLNGDDQPDIVQINSGRVEVYLRDGSGYEVGYTLEVPWPIAVALGDVNADDRPDIYVARRTAGNAGHLMLVNDGDGTAFTSMTIPQPAVGRAHGMLALDYDLNGRMDFVTLNGEDIAGPVKLTAFFAE